jgi:azurin
MRIALNLVPVMIVFVTCGARAGECQLSIEANDHMQFNQHQLRVGGSCESVEVTLKHTGMQSKKVMGHNWVLAKTSDVAALVSAGMSAGLANNYQNANDRRIIASTPVVGGGESTTITFSTAELQAGGDYTFFCTYPGHVAVMKGAFVFGGKTDERATTAATLDSRPTDTGRVQKANVIN